MTVDSSDLNYFLISGRVNENKDEILSVLRNYYNFNHVVIQNSSLITRLDLFQLNSIVLHCISNMLTYDLQLSRFRHILDLFRLNSTVFRYISDLLSYDLNQKNELAKPKVEKTTSKIYARS